MTRPSYGRFADETNTPTEILASTVGLEKFGIMLDNSAAAVAASLTTALAGANNDLTFTAKNAGLVGNQIEVAYIDPAGNNQALAVTVADGVISVSLATGAGGAITSTGAEILAAVNAHATAGKLVTVTIPAANDGTGVVIAMAAANLTGGTEAAPYGTTTLVKGTVMGIVTASGLYAPYNDANNDGTEVARGILVDDYVIDHADQNDLRLPAVMYIHGSFITSALTGLDANGLGDLQGRSVGIVTTF